jgi:hypothetical protein
MVDDNKLELPEDEEAEIPTWSRVLSAVCLLSIVVGALVMGVNI